jgi:hypothetical protein
VRVEAQTSVVDADEQTRQELLADGATPDEAARILDNFGLLWNSYDTLTEGQKKSLEQSRLNQESFFIHQTD